MSPGPAHRSRRARTLKDRLFVVFCVTAAGMSIVMLVTLLTAIVLQGWDHLDWGFLTGVPSRDPASAGVFPAMAGTILICAVCAMTAIPLGIGTAILLEEYKPKNRILARIHAFIQLNITNLAGVPSVVYGILGLAVFVQMFNLLGNPNDPNWTIGQRWYDYFVGRGGQFVYVRVDSRKAPPTVLNDSLRFTDEEGHAVAIRILDADEFRVEEAPVRESLDKFEAALREGVEGMDGFDAAVVDSAIDAAFAASGPWDIDTEAIKPQMIDALRGLDESSRVRRRRAVSSAVNLVLTAENAERYSGIVLSDARAIRTDRKRFYYMQVPFGRGILAGGMTLMLVVLPIIIIASQESLRAVPMTQRHGSLALGATSWQTIWKTTLPAAVPGIMTGAILAMSRAIGEAAPILIIAGIVYITFTPGHLMDDFTAMPLQIYDWASRPNADFHHVAASGIIVLLVVLLSFNALAVFIRQRTQQSK